MAKDEGRLRRWARLKAEARERAEPPAEELPPATAPAVPEGAQPAPAAAAAPAAAEPIAEGEEAQADVIKDLPDIDSLGKDSDYTGFMRTGVPEALRNRALRKLWLSDPVLANLDGLLEYGDDYTDAATVVENLKTVYRVGRGYLTDEEHAALTRKPGDVAEAGGEAPGEPRDAAEDAGAESEGAGDGEELAAATAETENGAPAGGRQGERTGRKDTDSPAPHGKHES